MSDQAKVPNLGGPCEGEIWERDDELFIVEKVYGAYKQPSPHEGTMPALLPVTLVRVRCIDPMPTHIELPRFLESFKLYDPHEEDEESPDSPQGEAER